jgi:CMP-N,N'-diacetyllegionaminic acid synthase
MKVVALIGARSGSSLKDKNIKLYKGQPLLLHSIFQAEKSKLIEDIYVSTDSKNYARIVDKYSDAKIIMRPIEISGEFSSDYEYIKHFLDSFNENERPDIIVQLRPTYPNRKIETIDNAIQYFMENSSNYDSLRSVIPIDKSGFKMYTINQDVSLCAFENKNIQLIEPYNQARQLLPQTYLHNGYIDIIKSSTIYKLEIVSGNKILPYIMNCNDDDDIDTIDDWNKSLKKS